MDALKLMALDAEDLMVISAHLQDAELTAADMAFWAQEQRFALVARRHDCKGAMEGLHRSRPAALQFARVRHVQSLGVTASEKERALVLLSLTFGPEGNGPEGFVHLHFADGSALRLGVECIEASLEDLGEGWEADAPA